MSDELEWSPLGEITSEELLDELSKRYESVVFIASRTRSAEETLVIRRYEGNTDACVGLTEIAKR